MSCLGVQKGDQAAINPWNTRSVIATATAAVVSVFVCSLLAILVSQNVMTSALSVTHLLIAGMSGGVFFGLVSLVIRYALCRPDQNQNQNHINIEEEHNPNPKDDYNDADRIRETPNNTGNSPLHPDGRGDVGATGGAGSGNSIKVTKGIKKEGF